jgi:hypothetical protein
MFLAAIGGCDEDEGRDRRRDEHNDDGVVARQRQLERVSGGGETEKEKDIPLGEPRQ